MAKRVSKSMSGVKAGAGESRAAARGTQPGADREPQAGGDPALIARARDALDASIIGHERPIAALAAAGANGTMHHAWIFHGPSGVGKCTVAMRFAALLADRATTADDWRSFTPRRNGDCAKFMRLGTHPDIRLIRKELAATSADSALRDRKQLNLPVGLLREHIIGGTTSDGKHLDSPAFRTSWMGGGKVFIIDEAELLDAEGQNALLKVLEEPPPSTWFVLVASHADRLLPTIRSRCQIIGFSPLSDQQMSQWAERGLTGVDPDERAWAMRFAAGSPGAARAAIDERLHDWWKSLEPHVKRLAAGEFPGGAAEVMADLVSDYAEAAVKRDTRASKEAANRRALAIILHMLAEEARAAMRRTDLSREDIARWASVPGVLADAEDAVDSNVNLKHALAYLVSQWMDVFDGVHQSQGAAA
ncbi:MAG: hypothetical protein O2819_00480 [Planctomycetota bacterium]|nr:hypothetical protein [Planctomycetota bacterium]MDA1105423.1 hypothetical protein [Planctomycetota bacterium]